MSRSAEIFAGAYDPPGASLACGSLLAVPFGPGRRLCLSEAQASPQGSRSRGERTCGDGPARSHHQILRPPPGGLDYLKEIREPTLIVQGSNDVIVPTVNSYILQQNLPNAELIVYPDANHGSFYQYPELFVSDADQFLSSALQDGDAESASPLSSCRFPQSS